MDERAEGAKRYGYTAAHRREDISPYSTNLTDAEWELVADLFERVPGQRGTPVHIGSILSKLHLADRTEAVAFAWRHGLMQADQYRSQARR